MTRKFLLSLILVATLITGLIGYSNIDAATYRQPLYASTLGDIYGWSVEKSDGAVLAQGTQDPLFTITGGPIRAKIVGIVSTVIGGTANGTLCITTTTPSSNFLLNAGSVAIDSDAAGTSYYNVGATSVFTPVTAGAVILDPVTVEESEFILPIGTVYFSTNTARSGVIKWYMTYEPLSPDSQVVAAD